MIKDAFRAVLWAVLPLCLVSSEATGAGKPVPRPSDSNVQVELPPPLLFDLGGLSAKQAEELKHVLGVEEVEPKDGRTRVVWQPYVWDTQSRKRKRIPLVQFERIYKYLAIEGVLGKTRYTHGGSVGGGAGDIFQGVKGGGTFNMYFSDAATGHNEVMSLYMHSGAKPDQLEHEMLRNVPGTKATLEKCGDGYVIVSRAGLGVFVVWQVSNQMYVRIDNSFDPVMVAAYVHRLGSITPKGYEISVDKWVANEIRWRMQQLDEAYRSQCQSSTPYVDVFAVYLTGMFPECQRYGYVKQETAVDDIWTWLHNQRNFLWANRENFKYNDATRGYVLKGPDRYDPKNPPDLPDELKDPPKPSEFKETPKEDSARPTQGKGK